MTPERLHDPREDKTPPSAERCRWIVEMMWDLGMYTQAREVQRLADAFYKQSKGAAMTITEKELWYLLDTLAVRESAMGGNAVTAERACSLMPQLQKPTPEECRSMYDRGYKVVRS